MPLISLKNIKKTYRKKGSLIAALDDVSLDIEKGEFVSVVGPSGCGKSTLLHILGLLDRPDSGEYSLLGNNVFVQPDSVLAATRNRQIGFVFQNFNLIPLLTVEENIALPGLYSEGLVRDTPAQLAGQLNIDTRKDNKPSELSGGQQQRVAIARAISNKPAVLLADEPTGSLDGRSKEEILSIFKEMNSRGVTIVLVTHDMELAKRTGRILELKEGKIAGDTRLAEPAAAGADSQESQPSKPGKSLNWPRLRQQLGASVQSMKKRKVKTALVLFSIAVSVAFSIMIFALGDGLKEGLLSNTKTLDAATIELHPRENGTGCISQADLATVSGPGVEAVYPVTLETEQIKNGTTEVKAGVYAMNPELFERKRQKMLAGSSFTAGAKTSGPGEIVLFEKTARLLFGVPQDAVGREVTINGKVLTVTGVILKVPQSRMRIEMPADSAVIPYTPGVTGARIIFAEVRLKDAGSVRSAAAVMDGKVKSAHGFNLKQQGDIQVLAQQELIDGMRAGFLFFDHVIITIITISMILGGIGVMNIMLANFAERTREIGLHKAIGATNWNIFTQYLGESVFMCFAGGLAGLVIGALILRPVSKYLTVPLRFDVFHIAGVLLLISCVGMLFGLYPARRAAKLDPIVALRD